jgi:hypothetical protein
MGIWKRIAFTFRGRGGAAMGRIGRVSWLVLAVPGCAGPHPFESPSLDDGEILRLLVEGAGSGERWVLHPRADSGLRLFKVPALRIAENPIIDGDPGLLRDGPPDARRHLARSLGATADPRAIGPLLDLLDDPDPGVAEEARAAFAANFVDVESIKVLKEWRRQKGGRIGGIEAEDAARLKILDGIARSFAGGIAIERHANLVDRFIWQNRGPDLRVDPSGTPASILSGSLLDGRDWPDPDAFRWTYGPDTICIRMSNIVYGDRGTTALVYFSWWRDGLYGAGAFHLLRKVDGFWKDIAVFGRWVSSGPAVRGRDGWA